MFIKDLPQMIDRALSLVLSHRASAKRVSRNQSAHRSETPHRVFDELSTQSLCVLPEQLIGRLEHGLAADARPLDYCFAR